ncbi:HipA N-terminal domain-containing protein [Bowmanella yangjiangensis]|nr:HipA N-terminal domain-containing protein [Bowmanella yangjiangensis]
MSTLDMYMNGYSVGYFRRNNSGSNSFRYKESWLEQQGARLTEQ